jgi:TRAP transporter TAXI family solute receptor
MVFRIGTADTGGTFDTQGRAIAEVFNESRPPEERCELTRSSASIDNANRLDRGEIEFGFMASNWVPRAGRGTAPFDHPIGLRMVSPANAGPIFFVALADTPVGNIADLAGRRVVVGAEGSGMTQHVHTICDALGIPFSDFTPVYMGFPEGADALVAGEVDVQFQCPIPNAVMTDLSERARVKVVPYHEEQIEQVLSQVSFYRRVVMRRGAFRGVDEDIPQLAVLNVLVTHERVDEDLVYAFASTLVRNAGPLARINPLFEGMAELYEPLRAQGPRALELEGVPLHPGAQRAYRDAGYL